MSLPLYICVCTIHFQAMGQKNTFVVALLVAVCCTLRPTYGDGIKLPDQVSIPNSITQQQQQQQSINSNSPLVPAVNAEERNRQGKHLLDFIGLGSGANTDPYLAKTNNNCLNGELAECFKSQAIGTFSEFFNKAEYRYVKEYIVHFTICTKLIIFV